MMKKIILSGIQPTGGLTLGNYLGAIVNWVKIQDRLNSLALYSIVDMHAITVHKTRNEMRDNILDMTASLLACGLNPNQSIIFQQSQVTEHAELAWLLSCTIPYSSLLHMTQFKEKGKTNKHASLGLFSYPVLMAADILVYKADDVPVGEDQTQHVELVRDIARRFNKRYGDLFPIPTPIPSEYTRVMSLRNGRNKMSKSDSSDMSRVNLSDTPDLIAKKIRKAKTDSQSNLSFDAENRPEVANLISIYRTLSHQSIEDVLNEYKDKDIRDFKTSLSDLLISVLEPIRKDFEDYKKNPDYLENILSKGSDQAREIASKTLTDAKQLMGLSP